MAKIFISFRNPLPEVGMELTKLAPFYEAFLNGFREKGNEVLAFIFKTPRRTFEADTIPQSLIAKLRDFKPDVCIIYNNHFWDITSVVDCPVVIYDVDSPNYFLHQEEVRNNIDRYRFITSQDEAISVIKDSYNVSDNQICKVPFFTEIHTQERPIENNIVFLGTNWIWQGQFFVRDFIAADPTTDEVRAAREAMGKFLEYPFCDIKEFYSQNNIFTQKRIHTNDLQRVNLELSGIKRVKYLDAVSDLGLEIRGTYWSHPWMAYFPDVMMCFRNVPTATISETEEFYNSAKISIGTYHVQAISGFSFRTCDILASNACLVSEYNRGIDACFAKAGIPTFQNQYEEREIIKDLLNNEEKRKDIVAASHQIIEKNYRFKNIHSLLEEFLNISLHSSSEGSVNIISDEDEGFYFEGYTDELYSASRLQRKTKAAHILDDPTTPKKSITVGKIRLVSLVHTNSGKKIYLGRMPVARLIESNGNYSFRLTLQDWLDGKVKPWLKVIFKVSRKHGSVRFKFLGIPMVFPKKDCFECMRDSLADLNDYMEVDIKILSSITRKANGKFFTRLFTYQHTFKKYKKYIASIDAAALSKANGINREYQIELLKFYNSILPVLEENNIKYAISGGGLVGCLRHGGFVPWDDDCDFEISRSEYDRLKRILKETYNWVDCSRYRHFTDFFNAIDDILQTYPNSIIAAETPSCLKIIKGSSLNDCYMLEFFPFDYVSDDITTDQFNEYLSKIKSIKKSSTNWGEFFDSAANFSKSSGVIVEHSQRLYYGLGNRGLIEFDFEGFRNADEFMPSANAMPFEVIYMPVPKDPHAWLSHQYANYMQLPLFITSSSHIKERHTN